MTTVLAFHDLTRTFDRIGLTSFGGPAGQIALMHRILVEERGWIDRLRSAERLKGGLAAITASIVGVIANLTLWFGLHILFTRVQEARFGVLFIPAPDVSSFDFRVAGLAALAFLLIFAFRRGVITTLALCSGGGLVLALV